MVIVWVCVRISVRLNKLKIWVMIEFMILLRVRLRFNLEVMVLFKLGLSIWGKSYHLWLA